MNAGRFAGGFLFGVVIVAVLTAILGSSSTATTSTSATSTAAPVARSIEPWFQPGEALIGATVILPVSLDVEGGTAYFDYDLAGLAPTLFPDESASELARPSGDVLELPESWELATVSGDVVTATTSPLDSSVSFELPSDDAEVATITLVGWRVPVPFGDSVTLPVVEGASGELRQGTVVVSSVLEQSISTIVNIDLERDDDLWESSVVLRPRDFRWSTSGNRVGGSQLTWYGDDAPDSIVIENAGYEMSPVSGSILVYDASVTP